MKKESRLWTHYIEKEYAIAEGLKQLIMEDRKLNILFISSWYPTRGKPLNGIFIKRHAEAVAEKCDVSVIFIRSGKNNSIEESLEDGIYTLRGYYKIPGFKVPLFSLAIKFVRYISMWQKMLLIYKKKKGKPGIINANVVYPVSIIATFIKMIWHVPYVITEHWTGYMPEDGRYRGFIQERISSVAVGNAAAIITPSLVLSHAMQSHNLRNKYFVIPNVVDTELFNIKPSAPGADGFFHLIHISSLDDEQKNVSGILRAFKKFHAAYPSSKLTLVCDEEIKENLERIRTKEPFSEDMGVFITGKKTGSELASTLQQADAFVLFSYYETQSVVLLESLCCGIPVISSRCGGPEEFITPANGLLVDKGDEIQLAQAMETMMKNRKKYNAEEVRKSVADMVSKESVAGKFLQVYHDVLKTNSNFE